MVLVTAEQMRQAEEAAAKGGLSYLRMMDNAGSAAARQIEKHFPSVKNGSVTVLCGAGNNGGDGFVVARRLAEKGIKVSVILVCGRPTSVSAVEMAGLLSDFPVKVVDVQTEGAFARSLITESALVVDGVFGTGFRGKLPATAQELFGLCRHLNKPVLALDLPSGIHGDSGTVAKGTPKCVRTVTFHGYKYAHVLYPSAAFCGKIHLSDIGLPNGNNPLPFILHEKYVASFLHRADGDTHKGTFGKAALLVGSKGMAGAAQFAVKACLRCGVGLAAPVVPDCIYPLVSAAAPEGVYRVYNADDSAAKVAELCMDSGALLAGCGLGNTHFTRDVCYELAASYPGTLVLDADGINSLAGHMDVVEKRKGITIMTPHPAEMARLLKTDVTTVQADRFGSAKKLTDQYGVVTVLKGANTIIAAPNGALAVNLTGNSGLSKGGSGDVLAGMIASLAAQGLDGFDAACVGVWLHGRAGDLTSLRLSKRGMLPSDVIEALPSLFLEFEK